MFEILKSVDLSQMRSYNWSVNIDVKILNHEGSRFFLRTFGLNLVKIFILSYIVFFLLDIHIQSTLVLVSLCVIVGLRFVCHDTSPSGVWWECVWALCVIVSLCFFVFHCVSLGLVVFRSVVVCHDTGPFCGSVCERCFARNHLPSCLCTIDHHCPLCFRQPSMKHV